MPAVACDSHAFFRVGAGKQGLWTNTHDRGEWLGDDGVAALLSAGYRSPIEDWLWWDIQYSHNSTWDRGWPFNNQQEDALDAITLGLEFRFYED